MMWYISAQNDERTSTEHFWISNMSMRELRKAVINGKDFFHIAPSIAAPCEKCARNYPDLHTSKVVSE